jgi:uncharacterized protein
MSPGSSAAFITKVTRLCNLRCSYCHDWRAEGNQTMSFATLARLVAEALRQYHAVSFIWHGGETTVMPLSFYRKAMAIQARFRKPGQPISNQLQTNGTLLDDSWACFLRDNQFNVGVSIDGPAEIHDRYRLRVGGQPSFRLVMRGIDLLRAHGVKFGIIMVLDEGALELGPQRMFDFVLELGVDSISMLPARPTNAPDAPPGTPTTHYVDAAQATRFFRGLYDRWLEHGDPRIKIRELDNIRERLQQRGAAACTMAGGCLGQYFLVEPNGEIAHCDLFVGDGRYTYGNIMDSSLADMLGGEPLRRLQEDNERSVARMRAACAEFALCNGGCPHDRYTHLHHDPLFSTGCCGQAELIAHIRSRQADEEAMLRAAPPGPPSPLVQRRGESKLRVVA